MLLPRTLTSFNNSHRNCLFCSGLRLREAPPHFADVSIRNIVIAEIVFMLRSL